MAVTNKKLFGKYGFDANNASITNVADPTNAQDVATKSYSQNASNLATGTVPTARLASGTASSSTYLRGDSTWQSLPATTTITGTDQQILANSTYSSAQSGSVTLSFPSTVALTNLTISGDLTVNGTTTNLNSTNLVVEDKNIVIADVASPTNTTADGGGITLKGATDKTFNWYSATGAWTSSEHLSVASGKNILLNGSTSGTITLSPAATAGTNTITLPATTGTVVTTGDSGTVTSTMIADGTIVDADINASASIAVSKLAASTISGKTLGNNLDTLTLAVSGTGLSGSATYNGSAAATFTVTSNATSANTASTIVARDASGNFTAGTITADLSGNATTATTATNSTNVAVTNDTTTSSYAPLS